MPYSPPEEFVMRVSATEFPHPQTAPDTPDAPARSRVPAEMLRAGSVWPPDGNLDEAVTARIAALVRNIVRSELYRRRAASAEDIEDVCSDAMVALLGRLEALKDDLQAAQGIQDFDAYIATIARRACSAWTRRRYPAFHGLRTRLRYLLNSDARFALWQSASGDWLCGWAKAETSGPVSTVEPEAFDGISPSAKPLQALAEIFDRAKQPLYFNDLARICARLWAVDDAPETMETIDISSSTEPNMEAILDRRATLAKLWREVQQLPQHHCAALLLNLRGPDGECATSLLVLTGTASLQALAAATGMSAEAFTELWRRLPLSDLEIAERMQITRQQVINLRKCAREKLRRRMQIE